MENSLKYLNKIFFDKVWSDLRHDATTTVRLLVSEALSLTHRHRIVDGVYGVFMAFILLDVLVAKKLIFLNVVFFFLTHSKHFPTTITKLRSTLELDFIQWQWRLFQKRWPT